MAHGRLDFRLILEVFGDALGGPIQNLPQQRRVTAHRHVRVNALKHVLEEMGNLLALAGFSFGSLFGGHGALTFGIGFLSQPLFFPGNLERASGLLLLIEKCGQSQCARNRSYHANACDQSQAPLQPAGVFHRFACFQQQ